MKEVILLICLVAAVKSQIRNELEGLSVSSKGITLSGFSSGGTFAQHMQFSYSSLFAGIAVFSHNYYRCGPGNGKVLDYDRVCTKEFDLKENEYYNPELVHQDLQRYFQNHLIEDPAQLKDKRLYVYTGLRNFLFTPAMSLNILRVYERYILNPDAIKTRVQDSNLVLPSNVNNIGSCTEPSPNSGYVGNCGFSGAYDALSFLLPDKCTHEPSGRKGVQLQALQTFDQRLFYGGIENHQMDTTGYLYVPRGCKRRNSACPLHMYFHGCLTGREFNGTLHIENSGYLEVAELNNIVIVFPQAHSSLPENEIGCWDTFGISGPNYATQEGAQVRVVKNILDKILSRRLGSG